MLDINELLKATNGKYINGNRLKRPLNYCIDSRIVQKEDFFVPVVGENVDGHEYIIDCIKKGIVGFFVNSNYLKKEQLINESININKELCIVEVDNAQNALYDAGKYNRQKHINIPVIAVTGSVGKTSTREMIASVLKTSKNVLVTEKNYNSCIGAPIMALKMDNQDVCVLEAGIDKIGEMTLLTNLLKPDISVITCIGTAHIGNFGSQDIIFSEKIKIFESMKKDAIAIVNGDDKFLVNLKDTNNYSIKKYYIDSITDISQNENKIDFTTNIYGKSSQVRINEIGNHNVYNALCAIKIGEIFGLDIQEIVKGISNYKNFARRLEKKKIGDITIIDDTYNASIDSMKSGLITVNNLESKRKIAILGDMLELGSFSTEIHSGLGEVFKILKFDFLLTLGKEAKNIAISANKYFKEGSVEAFEDRNELINKLKDIMLPGDLLFFKASNGMKFPEIIEALEK